MTTEEKKEILKSYRVLKSAVKHCELQIAELESSVLPKSANFDGMPHGSDYERDLSGWAAKCNELHKKLERTRADMLDAGNRIMDAIKALEDPLEKTVIFEHYISLKRIEKIARELNYCNDKIWKAHSRGVKHIKFN